MSMSKKQILEVIINLQEGKYRSVKERDKMINLLENELKNEYVCDYIYQKEYENLSAEEILELAIRNSNINN